MKILEELGDGNYTVVFDGTPYRCECFGVGIRFVGPDGKVRRNGGCSRVFYVLRPCSRRMTYVMLWFQAFANVSCHNTRNYLIMLDMIVFFTLLLFAQICQRLLSLSMLAKSMDFRAIFGEVHNILFKKFRLEETRCVGFMRDGCAANLKALDVMTAYCQNSVGIRCMSHLLNNCGDKIESRQIDKIAGALHMVLSHSANASSQWRPVTKVGPPKPPNYRWHAAQDRNMVLTVNWQGFKEFVDVFTTSDDTKYTKARFWRQGLGRIRPDGIHNEVGVQLEFALAVDIGVHLQTATYLLEGDGMLVGFSLLFVVLTWVYAEHACLL